MRSSVVFLGPSLPVAEARVLFDATYLPPVRRGDIDALLDDPPQAIGIVDGRFFQSFSISPKEVLRAMDAGIAVYGASSMGALRAAELHPYGMVGVGRIFAAFASGELDADDEVAMVYDPDSTRALSDPMVNIRFALEAAELAGVLSAAARAQLIQACKTLFYPDRSLRAVFALARNLLDEAEHEALVAWGRGEVPDAKREDARMLLQMMALRHPGHA